MEKKIEKDVIPDQKESIPIYNMTDAESSQDKTIESATAASARVEKLRKDILNAKGIQMALKQEDDRLTQEIDFVQSNIGFAVGPNASSQSTDTLKILTKTIGESQRALKEFNKLDKEVNSGKWKLAASSDSKGGKVQPQTQVKRDQKRNTVSAEAAKAFVGK